MLRKTSLALLIGLMGCDPGELTTDGFGGGGSDGLQQWCDARYDVAGSSSGIVNGTVTTDYPAIGYLSNGGSSFCTGSYIGDRMVLTAAHCVEDGGVGYFNFGNSDRAPEQSIRVTNVRIHPAWDSFRLLNDIAVLELQSNPTGIDPLPVLFDTPERGWTSTLVGFGVSDGYRQSGGGIKREVDVTIYDLESTTWSYRTARGGSACNGDSGGPAFYQIPGGPLAVMGITSWGDQYCVENGFYTRLDLYEDFLDGAETPDTTPDGPGDEPPPGTEPPPDGPAPEPDPDPDPEPDPDPDPEPDPEPDPGPGPGPGPSPGPGEPGPEKPPIADTCVFARDGYCDELADSDAPCTGRVDVSYGCAEFTDWTDCHPAP